MLFMDGVKLKGLPYKGELKPCRFCGSGDVQYFTLGIWKRLACFDCNRWIEYKSQKMSEEELAEVRRNIIEREKGDGV